MNNQTPYNLYKFNKQEFLNKVCAICLCTLYYPETHDIMVGCSQLNCKHVFHSGCIEQSMNNNSNNNSNNNNNKCPECRTVIIKKININKSLEIAIRNDAFFHNNVDESLMTQFKNNSLKIEDYNYHKIVFDRWRKERNV